MFAGNATRVSGLVLLICPTTLARQQVPTWSVTLLEGKAVEPFDNIRGARELSDGRLVVLDFGFFIVNLNKSVRSPIGRSGDGPGEYRAPIRIFPFRGDTTAYLDMARPRKVFFILPSGEFRGSVSVPAGYNARDPESADDRGGLYSQHRRTRGPRVVRDSTDVVRWDPGNGATDTLAALMERWPITSVPVRSGGPPPPFSTFEQWAVSRDGRVAVVSASPYRVTLSTPDAKVTAGPVLPAEQVRVTDAHRRLWLEKAMEPVLVLTSSEGGPRAASYRRRSKAEIEPPAWPKFLPPFLPGAVSFAPDGMLWVLRTTTDPSLPVVDIIDRFGRLAGHLALPKGRRLLCAGKNAVYLIRVDEDGLQYLEQYQLPEAYREATSH